ncbi:MAG: S8 family serine peptidase, partial [Planctomycetes bacterium]|nr:S8 family serine peptidase [Planctomycetota bacterium]
MPKAIADSLSVDPAQDRVVVKLAEGRPELADGRHILAPDICAVIGERLVRPYFEGLEVELAALRQRQLAATPPGRTPDVDLGLYYEVTTQNAADTRLLVQRLNELAAVELAYARALPTPPPGDILPVTPDFTLFQGYRAAAPAGVDADALLYTTGGSGSGVRVLDIEFSWQLQHEDIAALRPSSVVGPIPGPNYEDHGSAVAGVIAADADIYGVTGLAPDVELRVTTAQVFAWVDVPGAIATAMTALTAGDVLLIELQVGGPLGYLPVEWEQATFDAIRIASGLGITVVEPAGNGSVDLDHPSLGGLFDTNVRDSGAIVVAASGAGIATRASFSNYGARIDCNGWGYWVMTTGYGTQFDPGDQRQRYATAFGGTSSASAMVTGVVAGLRGAAEAQLSPQD